MATAVPTYDSKLGMTISHMHKDIWAALSVFQHFRGYIDAPANLPGGVAGDFAVVGTTDTMWVFDGTTDAWKDSGINSGVLSFRGEGTTARLGVIVFTAADLPQSGNWALTGNLVHNSAFADADVSIQKKTAGTAYSYNAGTDIHTFGSFPVGPSSAPTTNYEFANKKYVDDTVSQGTAAKAANLVGGNSTTLLGAIPYQSNTDTTLFVSPNTTITRKYLSMLGDGTNGGIPSWETVVSNVGTVTQVSVITANGVSGSVATDTSTPAITLTLGAITPSSCAATGNITSAGNNVSVFSSGASLGITNTTAGRKGDLVYDTVSKELFFWIDAAVVVKLVPITVFP